MSVQAILPAPVPASPWLRLRDFAAQHPLTLSAALLGLSLLPFAILGEGSAVIVHDNLDGSVPWQVVLAREGVVLAYDEAVEPIMNGVSRAWWPSGLNVTSLLFVLFPPFAAYLLNHILVHAVAFLGMVLLLRHLIPGAGWIAGGVALCCSLLPFYSMLGLTVAGQPLLLWAVLRFVERRAGPGELAAVLLFPFSSSLAGVGIFILAILGVWFLVDLTRRRRPNAGLGLCIVLLGAAYALTEWHLIRDALLGGGPVSHRAEFDAAAKSYGLAEVGRRTFRNVLDGQYHAPSLHRVILLLAVPAALVLARARRDGGRARQLLGLLGLCVLFSLALAVQEWRGLIPLKERLPLLSMFQFGRFHWLHPLLWFLAFGLALDTIRRASLGDLGSGRRLAAVLLVAQGVFVVSHNEEIVGTAGILARRALGRDDAVTSYAEFYSEPLFQRIARHIGRPHSDYRTVSIGLHPAIAAYNGFHTLDFYLSRYPLAYKHRFRRIIARELDKSPRWKRYFDGWGSRCYALVAELPGYSIPKTASLTIKDLELGTEALREMGGEYVLSAVEIENHAENGLRLDGVFEDEASPWKVWLYRAL